MSFNSIDSNLPANAGGEPPPTEGAEVEVFGRGFSVWLTLNPNQIESSIGYAWKCLIAYRASIQVAG